MIQHTRLFAQGNHEGRFFFGKMLTRNPPSRQAPNFAIHSMVQLSPQWMICGLSSRQACLEFSTLTFHLRPAQHVSPTLLYRYIAHNGDSTKLKEDLTALEDWESKWQMCFHPEKCTVLRITTNKRYRRETNYFLHGQRLQVADSTKYLGVTFSDDLQWEKHTQATAAKASRTLGFLRRNLKDCSKQVRSTTYKSMVRPTMEYASSSWDPYKTEDADYLDKVQRCAARYACNNYTKRTQGCVTAMVNLLGWETLQDRRKMQR